MLNKKRLLESQSREDGVLTLLDVDCRQKIGDRDAQTRSNRRPPVAGEISPRELGGAVRQPAMKPPSIAWMRPRAETAKGKPAHRSCNSEHIGWIQMINKRWETSYINDMPARPSTMPREGQERRRTQTPPPGSVGVPHPAGDDGGSRGKLPCTRSMPAMRRRVPGHREGHE